MTHPTYPRRAYPQPPQEPRKKHGVLKWVLIVVGTFVGLIVILGALAAMLVGGESAAPPPPSEESTAGESKPNGSQPHGEPKSNGNQPPGFIPYKIGEKATDDDYQFTVTKIKCGVSRVGDSFPDEKAQGQFCLVSLQVKNVGDDPINYSSENQVLIDTKGKNYSPDDNAWIYLDSADVELNPDNTLKTIVPFDIPKKAKPDHLLLKAGVSGASDGVIVKLR